MTRNEQFAAPARAAASAASRTILVRRAKFQFLEEAFYPSSTSKPAVIFRNKGGTGRVNKGVYKYHSNLASGLRQGRFPVAGLGYGSGGWGGWRVEESL